MAPRRSGSKGPPTREFGEAASSIRRTATSRYELPWTFSTSTTASSAGCSTSRTTAEFETAKVEGPHRRRRWPNDRGDLRAPLIVDALGWRRVLGLRTAASSRPTRRSRAGSRSIPTGRATTSRSGSTDVMCPPATAGASPPTASRGSASAPSIRASTSRDTTELLAEDLERDARPLSGQLDPAQDAPRDRGHRLLLRRLGGHCLPLTAEGIRTALYFGIALGRRATGQCTSGGGKTREDGAARVRGITTATMNGSSAGCCAPSASSPAFRLVYSASSFVRLGRPGLRGPGRFGHYLRIAPPEYVREHPAPAPSTAVAAAA